MSYCRFSDGDVYMYNHVNGFIECCACSLEPDNRSIAIYTKTEALQHLYKHNKNGDKVPLYAIARLEKEIKENKPIERHTNENSSKR